MSEYPDTVSMSEYPNTTRFLALRGQIVGVDFEHEGVTVVQVAIPNAECPPIGKERVSLWVHTEMTAEEWTAWDNGVNGKRECCQGADGLHHEDCETDV